MSVSFQELLAPSFLVLDRLQGSLADPGSLPLLHRSQWQCLASSYSSVLQSLSGMLDHARSSLMDQPSEDESMCRKLSQPLHALHLALAEAETCMQESVPSISCGSSSTHSWLVEKVLPQSMSTDVVDSHLHRLLCTFWVVCEQISRSTQAPPAASIYDGMAFSSISQLTKELCKIWACADSHDDLSGAQSFLSQLIKGNEEALAGETCQLAEFVLQKLSLIGQSTSRRINYTTQAGDPHHGLPPFLWLDPEVLQRNPNTLGEGAYAKVQEAQWLGARFAVKDFFHVENNEVFGREACIQAQLRHPNVLPLVCCTKIPSLNKCSLVMELMQLDLHLLMKQRTNAGMHPPFSLTIAVDLMLQIARGMEYLHSESLRIMHRDLKACNILVSFSSRLMQAARVAGCSLYALHKDLSPSDVHLKVADFGMSKAKYTSSGYSTKPVGTAAWRAPEVFRGNPEGDGALHPKAKYTNKADVYSFAMVCYEILTGKLPFEGQYQIQRRVLAGERPSLPSYCPPALATYIQSCWHAEPARRPPFTQICRMLRYFKACMLILHQQQQQKPADRDPIFAVDDDDWLLHGVSPAMCARIDDMLQSVVQQLADSDIHTQPVVLIPLEMYCCREILRNKEYRSTEANDNELLALTNRSSEEISSVETGTAGVLTVQSSKNSKGYLAGLLKRISCCLQTGEVNIDCAGKDINGTNDAYSAPNPDLGDDHAAPLAGGFTYAQVATATNNFADSSLLGQGGSAKVYSGMLEDGRRVAVKQADYGGNNAAMLSQELRIASQLRHRNVVPLLGWCQGQGKLLLVYEYMPNGDLWQLILNVAAHGGGSRSAVVEWKVRYKIINQVATALKYFHEDSGYKQIVHRDVKTCNIFLDSEWNARVGDCGLALAIGADEGNSNIIAGTRGYLAPEYARDGIVSAAGDIYSFGVTILEIATGRRALDSQNLVEWVWAMYERYISAGDDQDRGEILKQAADTRLEGRFEAVEMERVLLLGVACTNATPEARPDIGEVLKILSGVSPPPRPQLINIGAAGTLPPPAATHDAAPLQVEHSGQAQPKWSSTTTSIRF